MERPYIICHILSALDGRITGSFMRTEAAGEVSREYARIRSEYQADAWLYGTVTIKEFTSGRKPQTNPDDYVPDGDFIVLNNAPLYCVSIDTKGEIGWESGSFRRGGQTAHVIEVLTEQTPAAFRAYLRRTGVSYIIAGSDSLDCGIAAEKLYRLFGIRKLLICGGGIVNWTFLQQDMMDELSLLLAPAAGGDPDAATVFERMDPSCGSPREFRLKNTEQLKGDGIRLVYMADRKN